jgi:tRNA threonylcarbamoyl adenosine modification protein YeaZ
MLIVSFDIATEKMFLVIEKDDCTLAIHHEYSTAEKYNSAMLIPAIIEQFQKNNITPEDITLVAINAGPGSFTGIRAGAVVARTLGQFLNVPVIGVPSLEIYAKALQSEKEKYVILDARRSKWYTARYSSENDIIEEPSLQINTEVMEFIAAHNIQIITEKKLSEELKIYAPIFFEDLSEDFGLILTRLAKERFLNSQNPQEVFAWHKLKPTYLQTPSITMPKKRIIVE